MELFVLLRQLESQSKKRRSLNWAAFVVASIESFLMPTIIIVRSMMTSKDEHTCVVVSRSSLSVTVSFLRIILLFQFKASIKT